VSNHHTTHTNQQVQLNQVVPKSLTDALYSPMGLGLLACAGLLVFTSVVKNNGGKELARSKWATKWHIRRARLTGCRQIEKQVHNRVCLFIGTPRDTKISRVKTKGKLKLSIYLPRDPKTLYFPDSNRNHIVFGGPGAGKTFSVMIPLLCSAILQGQSIILYDFKYSHQKTPYPEDAKGQTAKIAGFASMMGYQIHVVAPGFKESCRANPVSFIKSDTDVETARQLAITLNRNFKLTAGSGSSDGGFFSNAGDQLSQAVFMLARGSKYPDPIMCSAILALPKLIERLKVAKINPWVRRAFDQFISTSGSEPTAASIVATASGMFSRFLTPSAAAAFCGETNLPLDLTRKQLLIFGMDKERRDVVGPLLASVLALLVNRNVSGTRRTPLGLSLDEAWTLYLPNLLDWLMQNREDGLWHLIAVQSPAMLAEAYGESIANALIAGCAHKWLFNPQDDIASERFSKIIGDEQIIVPSNSRSVGGGKGGASRTYSDQREVRALLESAQFNRLGEGQAIVVSPGIRSRKEVAIPYFAQIKIPDEDIAREAESIKTWYHLQNKMIADSSMRDISDQELMARYEEAERLLPLPQTEESSNSRDDIKKRWKAI